MTPNCVSNAASRVEERQWEQVGPHVMFLWLRGDKRLVGRWRSDRERTMAEWRFSADTPEETRARVANMFGELELSYSRWRCKSLFNGTKDITWYQVLAADPESVMIRAWTSTPFLGRPQSLSHIHFDADSYWITLGSSNTREFFRRLDD